MSCAGRRRIVIGSLRHLIKQLAIYHEQLDQYLVRVERIGRAPAEPSPPRYGFSVRLWPVLLSRARQPPSVPVLPGPARGDALPCAQHSGLRGSEVLANGAPGEMLAEEPGQE
jgi:hypothetical protein